MVVILQKGKSKSQCLVRPYWSLRPKEKICIPEIYVLCNFFFHGSFLCRSRLGEYFDECASITKVRRVKLIHILDHKMFKHKIMVGV